MNSFSIEALLNPAAFPHAVDEIKIIETHLSWIVLTGNYAYKVKKPVTFSFVDFSNLEKRFFFCGEELRLNRRFSPEIYLEIVPIRGGELISVDGGGPVVEFALKMKQLPQSSRLDSIIHDRLLSPEMIVQLAELVYEFHGAAEVSCDPKFAPAEMMRRNIDGLRDLRDGVEAELRMGDVLDQILLMCNAFIERHRRLFLRRQQDGFVRECHGDLHSRNIFFTDRFHLIDCIEFNADFRFIDVAQDVSFLTMDLEARGGHPFVDHFVRRYSLFSHDPHLELLLPFYECWASTVRSMVSMMNARDVAEDAYRASLIGESKCYLNLSHHNSKKLSGIP